MEGFKLYTPGFLLEQDHHELEVVGVPYVLDHDTSVAAIQQKLPKQLHSFEIRGCVSAIHRMHQWVKVSIADLQGLSPRNIVLRLEQLCVGFEEFVIVLAQEYCHQVLVPR